jgi:hypothetical protein
VRKRHQQARACNAGQGCKRIGAWRAVGVRGQCHQRRGPPARIDAGEGRHPAASVRQWRIGLHAIAASDQGSDGGRPTMGDDDL